MDVLVAIDNLDDLVHNAPSVPLTDQVRLAPERLEAAVAQLHATLPPDVRARAEGEGLLERLDAVVASAKPVPLVDQVRVDKEALYDVLDGLRAAISPAGP
jgi:hypothetical protein